MRDYQSTCVVGCPLLCCIHCTVRYGLFLCLSSISLTHVQNVTHTDFLSFVYSRKNCVYHSVCSILITLHIPISFTFSLPAPSIIHLLFLFTLLSPTHSPPLLFQSLPSFFHLSLLPTSVTHPGDLPCAASMKISSTFGAIGTQRVSISSPSHFVGCKVCKLATMLRMSALQSSKRSQGICSYTQPRRAEGRGMGEGWREEGKGGIEKATMTNSGPCQEILFVLCPPVVCLLPSALSTLHVC